MAEVRLSGTTDGSPCIVTAYHAEEPARPGEIMLEIHATDGRASPIFVVLSPNEAAGLVGKLARVLAGGRPEESGA